MIVLATNVEFCLGEKITRKVDQLASLRRKKLNKRMVIPTLSKPDLVIGSTASFSIASPVHVTGRTSSGAFTLNTADSPGSGIDKSLSFNSKGGQADLTFDNFNIVLD